MLSRRARLHVHHGGLLVSLLRALVAHHRCTGPGARKAIGTGTARHVTRVLRVGVARCRRVHLHLGVTWHAHKGPVGVLVRHHVSSHSRAHRLNELAALRAAQGNVLNVRAHAVVRHLHLLRVARHRLWLSTICVGRHSPGRGLHRGCGVRELHRVAFEVWAVGLHRTTARCVVRCRALRHHLRSLEVGRKLVLMGNRTV